MEPSSTIDFLAFAEHSADLVCRIGLDYRTRYVSPASRTILGFAPEEIAGRSAAEIIHPEDLPAALAAGERRLQGDESQATEMRVRNRQGEWVWLEMRGSVLRDAEGKPLEFLVIFRDIAERKRMELQLQRLAMTDSLTELPNRRAFDEALDREWRRVLREGTQASLLLLDVDHFKASTTSMATLLVMTAFARWRMRCVRLRSAPATWWRATVVRSLPSSCREPTCRALFMSQNLCVPPSKSWI